MTLFVQCIDKQNLYIKLLLAIPVLMLVITLIENYGNICIIFCLTMQYLCLKSKS